MALGVAETVSVLVGPACLSCESDDLRWRTPLGDTLVGHCRDCGTEYRWYEVPPSRDDAVSDDVHEEDCALCGLPFDASDDAPFCDDCELSDCAYCGVTTNRPLLSENLACQMCEGAEAA
jgi:hypothetical protein